MNDSRAEAANLNYWAHRPTGCAALAAILDRLSATDQLTATGREQLAGLQYALRIADS
jgi:hypothetical protein